MAPMIIGDAFAADDRASHMEPLEIIELSHFMLR